jgi:hypothetical protein
LESIFAHDIKKMIFKFIKKEKNEKKLNVVGAVVEKLLPLKRDADVMSIYDDIVSKSHGGGSTRPTITPTVLLKPSEGVHGQRAMRDQMLTTQSDLNSQRGPAHSDLIVLSEEKEENNEDYDGIDASSLNNRIVQTPGFMSTKKQNLGDTARSQQLPSVVKPFSDAGDRQKEAKFRINTDMSQSQTHLPKKRILATLSNVDMRNDGRPDLSPTQAGSETQLFKKTAFTGFSTGRSGLTPTHRKAPTFGQTPQLGRMNTMGNEEEKPSKYSVDRMHMTTQGFVKRQQTNTHKWMTPSH